MKTNHKRLLGKVLAPVALSGIIWSLNAQKPVQAQNGDLAAPPKVEQSAPDNERDDRPQDDERGPRGRRSGGENKPRPQGAGPRDHRDPARDGDDEEAGPPRRGPHDDERGPGRGGPRDERGPRGPRNEGDDEEFGPPRGGPSDDERGPGRGGPRAERPDGDFGPPPPGPRGAGPDDDRGPRGRGPRDGGPRDRGPEAGGPRGEGPREGGPGPGGPRGRRPGGRGNEIDEAGHVIGDVDIFQNLSGDAYNVSGQARAYYRRALTAQQSGDRASAAKYGRVSSELAHAAVRLAEVQTGKRVPELRGDGPRGDRPKPDAAREKEHATHVLNDAYRALGQSSGQWNATARRLYTQARNEFNAGKYEQAHGRAAAAMHLAEAGRNSA